MSVRRLLTSWTAAALLIAGISSEARAQQLLIPPVIQQTPVWCWAAVSEMALRHFNFPSINPAGDYQCGVVAVLGPICSQWCGNCVVPIGSGFALAQVLHTYQSVAGGGQPFQAQPMPSLSINQIVNEIAAGRPVAAGISPSGMGAFYPPQMSEHVALIIGVDAQTGRLLVNDPMPYGLFGYDPYIQVGAQPQGPGQYVVSYGAFAGMLGYKDSIVFK